MYKTKYNPVNCKNDTMMVSTGLRNTHLKIDRNVFIKNTDEKIRLKSIREGSVFSNRVINI